MCDGVSERARDHSSIGSSADRHYPVVTAIGEAMMFKWLAALVLALSMGQSAFADGEYRRYRHYPRYIHLPPERHVIEVVQPPSSGNFIINGTRFTAKTAACLPWAAGERIRLIAGDWHGRCVDAVFYNAMRHSTCEMWCR
jgi:hypothetical protein